MSNLVNVANNFDEFIGSGIVVVDFWATWCGPCRMLAPILDEVAQQFSQIKFGQVDVDSAPELARRFSIRSIPLVCIFENGKLVESILGLREKTEYVSALSKYL